MGTEMGPSFANLFLGHLEDKLKSVYQGPSPELLLRYIDDIFGITQMEEADLHNYIEAVQNQHPAIKYTMETSRTSVSFLDILFRLENGCITTSVHYKPKDSHAYLNYTSFHPTTTKNSIPYSQFLRIRRLTSNDVEFKAKQDEMASFFEARGYLSAIIQSCQEKTKDLSQDTVLNNQSNSASNHKMPFETTYHPLVKKVFKTINKNWHILNDDPSSDSLFQEGLMISFRKNKSLKELLVRASISDNADTAIGGTFPCNHSRCLTCPFTNKEDSIHGPDGSWRVKSSHSCTSTNVVYYIVCLKCSKLYVGETKRKLSARFGEHRIDIMKKTTSSPVAQYFNLVGHSLDDASVVVLLECNSDTSRKEQEMRLICKLGTLDPKGMNLDFTHKV
jgi:peptide-methionine (R)-S-oxide reductase